MLAWLSMACQLSCRGGSVLQEDMCTRVHVSSKFNVFCDVCNGIKASFDHETSSAML
jgi:hypothetical protein